MIPFLIASAIGGLFALVMPCVWPMVPITVNFFVKQGQGKSGGGKATGLAIIYCLSIIGVFTAVGVLFSFFFSALGLADAGEQSLAEPVRRRPVRRVRAQPAGLVRAPPAQLPAQASSKGESRGGLVGVVFMALTLTITSFTCTFPVVGGLLVMAAERQLLLSDRRPGDVRHRARAAVLPAGPLAGLDLEDAAQRRLDERRQGRRRPGRDRGGPEVHQHGRAGLRHPGERLVRRPGRPDVLDRPLARVRPLSPGRLPHRPRP